MSNSVISFQSSFILKAMAMELFYDAFFSDVLLCNHVVYLPNIKAIVFGHMYKT